MRRGSVNTMESSQFLATGTEPQVSQPPLLQKFEIEGLHGDRNVSLDFRGNTAVLIDGNGTGKTTVLNALFYILSKRTQRLTRFRFDKIRLTFGNGDPIELQREELDKQAIPNPIRIRKLLARLSQGSIREDRRIMHYWHELLELVSTMPTPLTLDAVMELSLFRRLVELLDIPPFALLESLQDPELRRVQDPLQQKLAKNLPFSVLYFPTYRRVEEDLHSVGAPQREVTADEELIHFGMKDVKRRLETTTESIRKSSIQWYASVSGQIVSQLTDGIVVTGEMRSGIRDISMLKIILGRIGENISNSKKEDILRIVETGQIDSQRYDNLVYFLSNLIKVYEQQREQDNAIKSFVRVCNGYLLPDKEIQYNESKLEISIIQKRSNRDITLDSLSSGEKQIVSIFSRLFLTAQSDYIILFDEPELSLSLEWQRKFLVDIVNSGKCALMIAATHSPFIFENELDRSAMQLSVKYRDPMSAT
jgi:predicted ATP-dependent endonuclease of OLD family